MKHPKRIVLCLLCCLLFFAFGCQGQKTARAAQPEPDVSAAVRADDTALEKAVARVLKAHPELVLEALESRPLEFVDVLNASMEKKREQEFLQDIKQKMQNPFHPKIDPRRPYLGAKDGTITIVLYSNYGCPYCLRENTVLQQLVQKYPRKIKLVLKHFPFEEVTEKCARIFEALGRRDMKKAWEFHEFLFQHRDVLRQKGMEGVEELLRQFGLDPAALEKESNTDEIKAIVKSDVDEIRKMGANGAPVVVINGVIVKGAQPLGTLERVIDLIEKNKAAAGD